MQKIRFVGPEGTPWVGRILRSVGPTQARVGAVERLCEETGLSVPQIVEKAKQDMGPDGSGLWAFKVGVFLAVNNAGFHMTLEEIAETFAADDVEQYDDNPPPATEAGQAPPDPSPAPTASARGDDVAPPPAPPAGHGKPKSRSPKRS